MFSLLFFPQKFVEAIYLNNDEVLNLQTSEDHQLFQWLKMQARRGAAEAEVHVLPSLLSKLKVHKHGKSDKNKCDDECDKRMTRGLRF